MEVKYMVTLNNFLKTGVNTSIGKPETWVTKFILGFKFVLLFFIIYKKSVAWSDIKLVGIT